VLTVDLYLDEQPMLAALAHMTAQREGRPHALAGVPSPSIPSGSAVEATDG
jgi:hypothetical protein